MPVSSTIDDNWRPPDVAHFGQLAFGPETVQGYSVLTEITAPTPSNKKPESERPFLIRSVD